MNPQSLNNDTSSSFGLQFWVFSLVAAAFTTIYITQPVLPVLQLEFGVGEMGASLTISAVIFGIALSNLPLGNIADRISIKPIILTGGSVIFVCGLVCALTSSLRVLVVARFIQGLFFPCLTTCVAAYLAKTLPQERLNVAMGSYVSATVAGGLGGRLLGGFIHPPLHWRYAFVTASVMLITATLAAYFFLPPEKKTETRDQEVLGFVDLVTRPDLLRVFVVAFSAFFVFASVFNYLPFYLAGPPFGASTQLITLTYCSYLIGIVTGPLAGRLCDRIGNGATMALGAVVFAGSLAATLIGTVPTVAVSLAGLCAGFFSIHSSAAGSLNRRLQTSRGRANSLYVLFYYVGGFSGISLGGYVYLSFGWTGLITMGAMMLLIPFASGLWDVKQERGRCDLP